MGAKAFLNHREREVKVALNGDKFPARYDHFRTKLSAMPESFLTEAVKSALPGFGKRVSAAIPELKRTPLKDMLFFDIETTGLSYNHPLFLVGVGEIKRGDFHIELYFAFDYGAEHAVIEKTRRTAKRYSTLVSYNGIAFDVPRVEKRAKAYNMNEDIFGHMQHVDLYPLVRRMKRLPNNKLQTIEKLFFGHEREHDILGGEIPKVYEDFVHGRGSEDKIQNIINHNAYDIVSTLGAMMYCVDFVAENSPV